ncbi:MAG: hypothetical protein ABIB93_00725 [Chloroflexota bacterium]
MVTERKEWNTGEVHACVDATATEKRVKGITRVAVAAEGTVKDITMRAA